MSFNKISDEGAQAIAEALKTNTSPTLNLFDNQISDKGARAIAETLKGDTLALQLLDLSFNKIMECRRAIAEALKEILALELFGFVI